MHRSRRAVELGRYLTKGKVRRLLSLRLNRELPPPRGRPRRPLGRDEIRELASEQEHGRQPLAPRRHKEAQRLGPVGQRQNISCRSRHSSCRRDVRSIQQRPALLIRTPRSERCAQPASAGYQDVGGLLTAPDERQAVRHVVDGSQSASRVHPLDGSRTASSERAPRAK